MLQESGAKHIMKETNAIFFRLMTAGITALALTSCSLGSTSQEVFVPDTTGALTLAISVQNAGETFNTVGQQVLYNYSITNVGQTILPGPVIIADNKMSVICPDLTAIGNKDGFLDPNETLTCPQSYSITQADLNAGSVANSATATVGGITSNPASFTVIMTQNKALTLTTNANPSVYNQAGQVINYSYIIKNSGIVTISGPFSISDNKVAATCPMPATGQLAPNEEITCTAAYTITQNDMTANSVTNSATATGGGATSNPATATITKSIGTPTQTPLPGNTVQHTVADGEWMLQIARCYGANFNEIRLANPQISDPAQLKPGMVINIPRPGSVGTKYGPPCVVFHAVNANDTWNSIASTYNADLTVLREANPGSLTPGRVLKVPKNSVGATQNVPSTSSKPIISSFTADVTTVTLGNVIVLRWVFSGQSLASARLTRTDPDGTQTALNGGADVANPGIYEDLAMKPGIATYTLQVSSEFGGTTTAIVTVNVLGK